MKIQNIATVIGLSLTSLIASASSPLNNEDFERHEYVDPVNNTVIPYRMLSPEEIESGEKYPLVIFLHGSGERGSDNEKQLTHGASTFSNPANEDKYPSYVVFPQCKERTWTEKFSARSFMPGAPDPQITKTEEALIDMINDLATTYPIDKNRIYIIGISMGGIATYDLACRYPELFAAAVPICGAVNPDRLSEARNVNFLIFHGEDDEEIPAICSREAYKTLSAAGAKVEYIEFAGLGHDCWTSAFNYPNFLPWLYSQSKKQNITSGNVDLTYMQ